MSQRALYQVLWEGCSQGQKNLLLAFSQEKSSRLQSSPLIHKYDLGSPASVSKNLKALIKKEVLENGGKAYSFADPFFALWIHREILAIPAYDH